MQVVKVKQYLLEKNFGFEPKNVKIITNLNEKVFPGTICGY